MDSSPGIKSYNMDVFMGINFLDTYVIAAEFISLIDLIKILVTLCYF